MEEQSMYMLFKGQGMLGRPEGVPEWYYLRPLRKRKKVVGLAIGVHPSAHEVICSLFDSTIPGVAFTSKELGIEVVPPKTSDNWGFGKVFQTVKTPDLYPEYQLGSQFLEYLVDISEPSQAICANLAMVFSFLTYQMEGKTDSKCQQLAIIDCLGTSEGLSARGVTASISPIWRRFLLNNEEFHHQEVTTSMHQLFNRLAIKFPAEKYEFRIWTDRDRFGISAPGNCACFGVDGMQRSHYEEDSMIYEVSSHNMDNLYQQFSILAGFAQLWEMVRKAHVWNLGTNSPGE